MTRDGTYLLVDGRAVPVPFEEWLVKFDRDRDRRVALDEPFPGVRVSTVFLGIDHGGFGGGPPQVFETMVFGGPLNEEIERYSTLDQAKEGHDAILQRVKEAGPA